MEVGVFDFQQMARQAAHDEGEQASRGRVQGLAQILAGDIRNGHG
jgi:hypothetical protein